MIYGFNAPDLMGEELGSLAKDLRIRVLNCSATGCLIETSAPVPVGTVAVLRVMFGGREFDDTVQVVRCQPLAGAGTLHHVATEFLSTTPPYAGSLRHAMRLELSTLAGWLRTKDL